MGISAYMIVSDGLAIRTRIIGISGAFIRNEKLHEKSVIGQHSRLPHADCRTKIGKNGVKEPEG